MEKSERKDTPVCPYCNRPQWDYEGSVNLENAQFGETVIHFCEYENDCDEIFYVEKTAKPQYLSKPKI